MKEGKRGVIKYLGRINIFFIMNDSRLPELKNSLSDELVSVNPSVFKI